MFDKKHITKIIVVLILLVIAMQTVNALGVTPARSLFKIDEGKNTGQLRVLNNQNQNLRIAVYATGEYADAIIFDNNVNPVIRSDENVRLIDYTVNFPEGLPPGRNEIEIVILHLPPDDSGESSGGIVATTSVIAKVLIDVPYPGKYLQSKLHVDSVNKGDTTTFSIGLFGKGKEDIGNVKGTIIIKGPTNEEIDRIETNSINLPAGKDGKIIATWEANYNSGLYYAEAIINFDGQQVVERETFMIGDKSLNVADLIIDKFKIGQIAKVDVIAESVWDGEIKDVHAELDVFDESGMLLHNVKTSALDVPSLGRAILSGYWDTAGMAIGNYDINVKLMYDNKVTERLFQAIINADNIQLSNQGLTAQVIASKEESGGSTISLLIVAVIVLIIINISWFVYFKKFRKKKNKDNGQND